MRTGTARRPLSEFTGRWRAIHMSSVIHHRCLFLGLLLQEAAATLAPLARARARLGFPGLRLCREKALLPRSWDREGDARGQHCGRRLVVATLLVVLPWVLWLWQGRPWEIGGEKSMKRNVFSGSTSVPFPPSSPCFCPALVSTADPSCQAPTCFGAGRVGAGQEIKIGNDRAGFSRHR